MNKLHNCRPLNAGLTLAAVLFAGTLLAAHPADAITFDWATIGDTGNAYDTHGGHYGGVDYEYRISKHEVTNAQYVEFLNAAAASDPFALYSTFMSSDTRGGITRSGSPGSYSYSVKADAVGQGPGGSDYGYGNKPVVYVSWYDTLRFANWLTSGTTESGTYTITGGGANSGAVTVPHHSTFAAGSDTFFLPSEHEWYKAAYYDGSTYFDYPTGTDSVPDNNLPSADIGNSANWEDGGYTTGNRSYPLTDVGDYGLSASPYGTFDQCGNVWEWNEAEIRTINESYRGLRGGSWDFSGSINISAKYRFRGIPTGEGREVGFRIASSAETAVPEPSTVVLGAVGGLLLMLFTRRRFQGSTL